jgi:large subunit ribosomal protein L9
MKVILQQDVKGHGKKGQMVEVSDGYGRNFLLPRKLAVEATAENVNTMKMQGKAKKAKEAEEKAQAQAIAEQLKNCQVKISAKAGQGGRLFGSVTSKEISESLKEQQKLDINKTKIVLPDPIKSFGTFEVKCKLGHEITGTINVLVVEQK